MTLTVEELIEKLKTFSTGTKVYLIAGTSYNPVISNLLRVNTDCNCVYLDGVPS